MKQKNLINIHCGEMIYKIRKSLKLSQDELASAVGLTRPSIVNIEKGRQGLTVEILLKICAVLKCEISDILPNVPAVTLKPVKRIKKQVIKMNLMDANFKW